MKSLAAILLSISLYSCGSSSGSNQDSSVTEADLPALNNDESCGRMNDEACAAFKLVNQERTDQGLSPLAMSDNCTIAAQSHAQDMKDRDFFSHDSPGETWSERMARFNVTGTRGENIAIANSAANATRNWMNSTGHRNNILNSSYTHGGMGYVDRHYVHCFTNN